MGEWISVKDRLPKDHHDVLCWYKYNLSGGSDLYQMGIGHCWHGEWAGEHIGSFITQVLYWQPLPKPPKED